MVPVNAILVTYLDSIL